MGDVMVTGRMGARKKEQGNAVLADAGLNASQAINLLYDRLLQDRNVDFLAPRGSGGQERFVAAAAFVDGLSVRRATRFDDMTDAQVKRDRLAARGLL